MIRELIAKCPDPAAENVLADWCEENRRPELVPWLRSERDEVRAAAVRHLSATLEPGVTAAAWESAANLARALGLAKWTTLADRARDLNYEMTGSPLVFFASSLALEGTVVHGVTWALAKELLVATPRYVVARVRPLAELLTHPCPTCQRSAIVIAEDRSQRDAAGDHDWWTEAYALCIDAMHIESIGVSERSYQPWSE